MSDDKEQRNERSSQATAEDPLSLGRELFARHTAFADSDPIGRATINRYASFLRDFTPFTEGRWDLARDRWGGWQNLEWLQRRAPDAKQGRDRQKSSTSSALARSAMAPAAENSETSDSFTTHAHITSMRRDDAPGVFEASPSRQAASTSPVGPRGGESRGRSLDSAPNASPSYSVLSSLKGSESTNPHSGPAPLQIEQKPIPLRNATSNSVISEPGKASVARPLDARAVLASHAQNASPSEQHHKGPVFMGPPIYQRSKAQRAAPAESASDKTTRPTARSTALDRLAAVDSSAEDFAIDPKSTQASTAQSGSSLTKGNAVQSDLQAQRVFAAPVIQGVTRATRNPPSFLHSTAVSGGPHE
jgi:hypothetical protein